MFRYFFALRPLLILVLAAGAITFAPEAPTHNQQLVTGNNDAVGENGAQVNSGTTSDTAIVEDAPASFFDALFGKGTTDPLFKLPEGPIVGTDGQNLPEQEPQIEPQRSIYQYLVAASDIGFESDTSRLKLALATAEQGQTNGLKGLIEELRGRFEAYQALVPPEELRDMHEQSSRVVLQYIQLLQKALAEAPGGVMTTWQSDERTAVVEAAKLVNQQIQEIVHKYNISLPEGVIP